MNKIHSSVFILFLTISIISFAQPAPQVGKRWIVVPELTDEFEGTVLNSEKWTTDHNVHPVLIWPGRPPALFHPDKVTVDSGRVTIEVGKLPQPMVVYKYGRNITYEYYGGCIRGFTPARIGQYYECEAKMNKTEMGGGFWMASGRICGKVKEIDITESVGVITDQTADWAKDWDHIMHSNGFYTKPDCSETTQSGNKMNLPTKNHEQFYRYGFWWKSPRELLFYINGDYAYSITLPDESARELYLQYDIEAYDWNPFPADGGKVANGSLEERTTQINYIHTFRLLDADNPGPGHQIPEVFNIYAEEVVLNKESTVFTTNKKLSIPLTYKANEDREIHIKLLDRQKKIVGESLMPVYAGYANLLYEFNLDSVPAALTGYTLYADIRPINSTISDTIMTDSIDLELRKPSVVTIQVMDNELNNPLQNVRVSLNDTIRITNAEGLAVFQNLSVNEYSLELTKVGYNAIRNEKLQIFNDTLIIKYMSPERFSLLYTFFDYNSSAQIKNAEVTLNDSSQNTGASGRVIFYVKKGKYALLLKHSNYLFSDSIAVSQNSIEDFTLKKTFCDLFVIITIDNKAYADIEVSIGKSTISTDSQGRITFPLLKVDSTYHYRIIKDSEILKEDSVKIAENQLLTVNISSTRSFPEARNSTELIYPNPVGDILYLNRLSENQAFRIFNLQGVEVKSGVSTDYRVLTREWPKGAYFFQIQGKTILFIKD